jgi:phenylacetic acid degradation protein PaaD
MTQIPAVEQQRVAEQAAQALYERDRASQALGMRLAAVGPGSARVVMMVRADMVNGHRLCHGGIVFALADSAFAFACNSYNDSTVAAAGAIDFLSGAREGGRPGAVAHAAQRHLRDHRVQSARRAGGAVPWALVPHRRTGDDAEGVRPWSFRAMRQAGGSPGPMAAARCAMPPRAR